MLVKNVKGRLGNQMFQYATMYAVKRQFFPDQEIGLCFKKVEKKANKEGFFEVNSLKHFPELEYREIPEIKLSARQKILVFRLSLRLFLHKYLKKNTYPAYRDKLEHKYQKRLIANNIVWRTSGFEDFDFSALNPKEDIIFYGYFEAPAYFARFKKALKKSFTPEEPAKMVNEDMLAKIKKARNPVCVSIRRGDFVSNEKYKKCHFVCDELYFKKAIEECKKMVPQPRFFVFSDDPEWVKNNLDFPRGTVYEKTGAKLPEKIILMTACKHFVVSNSSFSWWMQYLGRENDGVIIAPDRWNNMDENRDIYEKDWTLIQATPTCTVIKAPSRLKLALNQIRPKDFLSPLIFLLVLIPSLIFRLVNKIEKRKLWLICEDKNAARDNGYHFYNYVRKNHLEDFCFYVVDKKSKAYERVKPLGNIIQFGSLKHWLYYLAADLNISNQKGANPNTAFFHFLHVRLGLYKNRVFLQHGITHNNAEYIHQKKTKFKYFICGAEREYEYVLENFGYSKKQLLLTGFPRWDNLKNSPNNGQRSILIMPTWRDWLSKTMRSSSQIEEFATTAFSKNWNAVLTDKTLIRFIEQNDIMVYFCPHVNMEKFLTCFKSSKNIKVLSAGQNIQEYLKKCNLMVTDYSSAAFDFAFLEKPVLYYQFDINEYRKKQYGEGYFDYLSDGFGKVCAMPSALVAEIIECARSEFKLPDAYRAKSKEFFTIRDRQNCRRIYDKLKKEK